MKDTVIQEIEAGRRLTGPDLGRAEQRRTALFQRVHAFLADHEFMVCPVSQVAPFDVNQEYVTEINGEPMDSYIDWFRSCYFITITGLPAISVPCGFTSEGLPVGVQIVGRHHDDWGVLQMAYAFQQATEVWRRRPMLANS